MTRLGRWVAVAAAPLGLMVALVAPAQAIPFRTVAWTNTPGQEATLIAAAQGLDPTTDILASQISSNRGEIDTLTHMAKVSSAPPLAGTGLVIETFFTYQQHQYYLFSERYITTGDRFELKWLDTTTPGQSTYRTLPCADCTGRFDTAKNTISFHVPMKSLNKAIAGQRTPPIGQGATLQFLETDSGVYLGAGVPGVPGELFRADQSKPKDPNTALVIP